MERLISFCKQNAVNGMEHFLTVLSHVPEDKLDWTPGGAAKPARRIAAHTAIYAGNFAEMMRERKLPGGDRLQEWLAGIEAAELALTDLTEMERLFRQNTELVLAALDSLGPEEIAMRLVSSPEFSIPMTYLMYLPGMHAYSHTAQLDYLQTCWGDQVVHF